MMGRLLQHFDFGALDGILSGLDGQAKVSFSQLLRMLLSGDVSGGLQIVKIKILSLVAPGFAQGKDFFYKVILLAVAAMLLKYLSSVVKNRQVRDVAFYLVYLVLVLLILETFEVVSDTAGQCIVCLKEFVLALIPAFCLSISLANGTASGAVNYQIMLWFVTGICYILDNLLLPMSQCYLFLGLMNGLDEKKRMKGFMGIAKKGIGYGIRACMTVMISISALENIMAGQVDGLQKTVVHKMIAAIPGFGDLSESVTQVFLHSAGLIRNGIGVAAIIGLILYCMNPLVKLLSITVVMKLSAAILRFCELDNLADTLYHAGEGSLQMFKISLCCMLMFLVVIASTLCLLGRTV